MMPPMIAEPSRRLVDVLSLSAEYLAGRGVETPRYAAELLASRLYKCKRLQLYLMHDKVLDEVRLAAMRRGVKRVGDGEPIQYLEKVAGA
jgi:release factor glutamine methyltransferase